MSNPSIKPMGTVPLMLSPSTWTFPCFTDPKWVDVINPTPGIEKWSWYSVQELRTIFRALDVQKIPSGKGLADAAAPEVFTAFSDLNRSSPGEDTVATWFIAIEIGYLYRKYDISLCPWTDPNLYIPERWGTRMFNAAKLGLYRVRWVDHNLLQGFFLDGRPSENVIHLVRET